MIRARRVKNLPCAHPLTHIHPRREIKDEKELFDITTSQPRVVCHFFHPDFRRCAIIQKHLEQLAGSMLALAHSHTRTRAHTHTFAGAHFTTKFVKVEAEKAPFLTTKLNVVVLPTIIIFIDGIAKDRVVGFDDLGNTDTFKTSLLEVCRGVRVCVFAPVSVCSRANLQARLARSKVLTLETTVIPASQRKVLGFAQHSGDRNYSSDED